MRSSRSGSECAAARATASDHIAARARGEATVPTQIGLEKATNPFLRPHALAGALGLLGQSDVSVFAALRAAKDGFKP
jgi:hydroxyacylglutathione hydrolase